ncbi:putative short-chain dehydrogenase protein [Botrytis cinerea BcDW1]|uniref:Putative short-chain dehydrogenase protein n=1 Tax=Botryotinia fuckeliana (strain BcDW1) TaxID=1290391 RepID=M7UI37_BOTF1|nr:putative short-chain dehydrogenase protein [Botrytis cinerea BcDW1]
MTFFDINTTGDDVLKHFYVYAEGKTFVITGPSEMASEPSLQSHSHLQTPRKLFSLAELKSVRQAAEKIKTLTDKINIFISNAGVMAVKHYATSVEGVESQFAANYLGHFLLTNLLAKEIVAAASEGARIVQVGSLGYQLGETHIEDINFKDGETYNPWIAYGQAKTAMLLFNLALDKRLKQKGITALICHPGGNPLPPQVMVTLKQAAGVVLFTALNPSLTEAAPAFIVENEIYTETKEYALNEETAEGLWKLSEKLVGETFVY